MLGWHVALPSSKVAVLSSAALLALLLDWDRHKCLPLRNPREREHPTLPPQCEDHPKTVSPHGLVPPLQFGRFFSRKHPSRDVIFFGQSLPQNHQTFSHYHRDQNYYKTIFSKQRVFRSNSFCNHFSFSIKKIAKISNRILAGN